MLTMITTNVCVIFFQPINWLIRLEKLSVDVICIWSAERESKTNCVDLLGTIDFVQIQCQSTDTKGPSQQQKQIFFGFALLESKNRFFLI